MTSQARIRVLIVDDDQIDRRLYKQCLQDSPAGKFEFAEADCGEAGLNLAASWRPDCTLLDFNLPDMDGLEVLQRLRSCANGSQGATVMLTAYGGEELAVKAMKEGACDYLPKAQLSEGNLRHAVINAVERHRMQQQIDLQRTALAAGERRYQNVLEAIPQMVWSANAAAELEYANRRWYEYTGLVPHEPGSAHLGWDTVLHPDDRERTWRAWNEATAAGATFEIEHRLRRASDGSYRWHLVRAVPLREDGHVASWFGTSTEIEDQKKAESVRREEQKLAGLGRLVGGVAHDFNNLLVCVLGGASSAMDSLPEGHSARPMLGEVLEASERLAELTRKMLAYAGKASLRLEPADAGEVVREACESIRPSIPKGIRLVLHHGIGLPPVTTDTAYLRQSVVDLVANAVEAIGERSRGQVEVSTMEIEVSKAAIRNGGFSPAAKPGTYVALEVRDTGCGMDEETRNKIFDPFFTTKFLGRGLGLAAVQGFIRSTGGGLQVESKPGSGTAIRILLPIAAEKIAAGLNV